MDKRKYPNKGGAFVRDAESGEMVSRSSSHAERIFKAAEDRAAKKQKQASQTAAAAKALSASDDNAKAKG